MGGGEGRRWTNGNGNTERVGSCKWERTEGSAQCTGMKIWHGWERQKKKKKKKRSKRGIYLSSVIVFFFLSPPPLSLPSFFFKAKRPALFQGTGAGRLNCDRDLGMSGRGRGGGGGG